MAIQHVLNYKEYFMHEHALWEISVMYVGLPTNTMNLRRHLQCIMSSISLIHSLTHDLSPLLSYHWGVSTRAMHRSMYRSLHLNKFSLNDAFNISCYFHSYTFISLSISSISTTAWQPKDEETAAVTKMHASLNWNITRGEKQPFYLYDWIGTKRITPFGMHIMLFSVRDFMYKRSNMMRKIDRFIPGINANPCTYINRRREDTNRHIKLFYSPPC